MKYTIIITKSATADMDKTFQYISEKLKNSIAAARLITESKKAINSLSDMPYRIPLVRDDYLAEYGIRMIQIKKHLAFFVIAEDTKTIYILRFLYSRRDWHNILKTDIKEGNFS